MTKAHKSAGFQELLPDTERNQLVDLFNAGRHVEVENRTRTLVELHPDLGFAWKLLGATLQVQGKDALPAKLKAAELLPDDAEAHFNLGNTLIDRCQVHSAVASYQRALEIAPDYAEAHNNLGNALRDLGDFADAVSSCRRALEIRPDFALAYSNLGAAQKNLGQYDDALASYRRALEINPDFAMAHSNLGAALQGLGKFDGAAASYRQALEINPDYADAQNNLGNALQHLGRLDEAMASYRQALEVKPDFAAAHSNLIFTLDLATGVDLATLQQERTLWDTTHAAPLAKLQRPHPNRPEPLRRLRIGYVSADFREHSAAAAFGAMLLKFDPAAFEVFAYSNTALEDVHTRVFQQSVSHWRKIVGMTDQAVADLIRQDQIDILVDLSGHSAGNRLLVFARKPAPIQVTAWGYASSTGLRAMDVFFADLIVVPLDEQHFYAEEVRYLPCIVGYHANRPFPPVTALPAPSAHHITFGSFNRLTKVSDEAYRLWAQILLAVPDSRMVIKSSDLDDAGVRARVLHHFTRAGVDPTRITLLGKTSWVEHVAAFNQIDIALDPFPHGGGITTLEGLMMGVPVITRLWPSIAGRVSASILTALGLNDWIAESSEQYVNIARQKSCDLRTLADLRQHLRPRLTASIIGDAQAYVRAVEHEYRRLWRRWCERLDSADSLGKVEQIRLPQPEHSEIAPLAALFNTKRYAELEDQSQLLLKQYPDSGIGWKLLGISLQAQGKLALPAKQRAAELLPDDAEAHYNLGNARLDIGQLDDAAESCRRALEVKPDFAEAYSSLGAALKGLGELDVAVASYHHALEIKPDFALAYSNLGSALKCLGRPVDAVVSYRRALAINPDLAEAHSNLGVTLKDLGQFDNAVVSYCRALAINVDYADVHSNMGSILQHLGQLDQALASHRRALSIKPDSAIAHSNLIFTLDLSSGSDLAILQQERVLWDSMHAAPLAGFQHPHANRPDPARRLRIGYVSADFREHSAASAFGAMLLEFDAAAFEVFAYSNSTTEDALTRVFRQGVSHWRKIVGKTDQAVADVIRQDQIDILVDLSGHSAGNRLLVFARKPAPIQVTAWGYTASTGLRAMDVFFADPIVVPPDEQHFYAEEIRYLPCVVGYYASRPFPPITALPALSAHHITFGSFNRLTKVSDEAYQLWAQILLTVPSSRMVIKTGELDDAGTKARVLQHFTQVGVDAARITLLGKTSWVEHVAAFGQVDIGLDPFPQGGGVTTLEGLKMGVPVVTRRWATIPGRVSASILTTLGLTDWIAESPEQYVDIAVHQAHDLTALADLRVHLRRRFTSSVIGDPQAYVRAVELEYRTLWRRWCGNAGNVGKFDQTTQTQSTSRASARAKIQQAARKIPPSNNLLPQVEINKLTTEQKAAAVLSDDAEAHYNLGATLHVEGQLDAAVANYRRALEIKPVFAAVHSNLGAALKCLGRLDDAVASYRVALEINPDFADAHYNLGIVQQAIGQLDDAVTSYRRAIKIDPDLGEAHSNLGNAFKQLRQLDEAIASYHKALEMNPDYAAAHYNLGIAQLANGQLDDAVTSFRRAVEIDPHLAEAHSNLGNALEHLGQRNEAIASYHRALGINPDFAAAHYNLGIAQLANGQLDDAVTSYRHAVRVKPDYAEAHSNVIFALDMSTEVTMATLQQERGQFDLIHAAPLAQFHRPHTNRPDPARRLRIGYVSADFRTHSAASVFGAMLIEFDPAGFEVFAYSNGTTEDEYTRLFQQGVNHWRKIADQTDDAVSDLIRQDEIDILVDLSGHSSGNRLLLFARKPAPIQITAWGYASSTGLRAMDVFFADPIVVPADEKRFYTEEVRYLPCVIGHYLPYELPPVNPLPARSTNRITFGSFNRLTKISDEAYQVWAQILLTVPDSRMLLKAGELDYANVRTRVLQHFTRAGVDAARITLVGKTTWLEHVGAFGQVDISLDPFPQGGGVTTLEGLKMGVPIVTRRWPTIPGRVSASILTTLSLTDWIAETPKQYVEIAVHKAHDLTSLADLRLHLRARFTSSIIGDPQAYVRAVELEYRTLWRRWCANA